ncbi:hypothetical protein FHU36_003371 [Nonomuraea muscovyensis]|uniref:Uncharacterized protein n=1 Tax=Nonomuraea muscovyensis TaxID=1124761 RepID=A0A7X0C4B4_9ACTN|nr:hypothetical protein [Nonomuraea muscovyensis]
MLKHAPGQGLLPGLAGAAVMTTVDKIEQRHRRHLPARVPSGRHGHAGPASRSAGG